jgi:hypothetical protein
MRSTQRVNALNKFGYGRRGNNLCASRFRQTIVGDA